MPRKKNQIINLTIVLATSSIYIRSSPYKRSRSKLRVLYKFNKFTSDRVDVKSTTTHVRYIINLFTHSFFIYTKKKILANVEIYDKRIVSCGCDLYQLLFPRHLMLKILCLNGSVCVSV